MTSALDVRARRRFGQLALEVVIRRGIALVFLVAGIVMVLAAIGAFFTKSYRRISAQYLDNDESVAADSTPDSTTEAQLKH